MSNPTRAASLRAASSRRDETQQSSKPPASRFQQTVGSAVRTAVANVEDTRSFAWLQFRKRRPESRLAFAWLCPAVVTEPSNWSGAKHLQCEQVLHAVDWQTKPDRRLEVVTASQAVAAGGIPRPPDERNLADRDDTATQTGWSRRVAGRRLTPSDRKLRDVRRAQQGGQR